MVVEEVNSAEPREGGEWTIHALRFATATDRRSTHFLRYAASGLPDGDLVCDFYFWVLRSTHGAVWLFDSGFSPDVGAAKGKQVFASFHESLAALGLIAGDVDAIVYSHLHYDHSGHLDLMPRARVFIQRAELEFWTSKLAERKLFAQIAHQPDIDALRRAVAGGRVYEVDGDEVLAPGIVTVPLAGHTAGQQGLLVTTSSNRRVLLASDALHFYDELAFDLPFAIVDHLAGMYESFDKLAKLGVSGIDVVPGHDPDVKARYPARQDQPGLLVVDLT